LEVGQAVEAEVLLVTHSPCPDGDSARELIRMVMEHVGARVTEVSIDHRQDPAPATARITEWVTAHRAHPKALALFFDTSPHADVRALLLEEWRSGSEVRVMVGDHHVSEEPAMVAFAAVASEASKTAEGAPRFGMEWGADGSGVSGVTLAHRWALRLHLDPCPLSAVNANVLRDIAITDTTRKATPLTRCMAKADFLTRYSHPHSLREVLTASPELYDFMTGWGRAEEQAIRTTLGPLLDQVRKLPEGSAFAPPGTGVYVVREEDARKANDLADLIWEKDDVCTDAVLVMRTGPTSASLRHAPVSTVTALDAARWLWATHAPSLKPAGGHIGAAGVTLSEATLDAMFAEADASHT
jgi:hypothetical protein